MDNTTLNSGSGGDVLRDKDRAGVKTQIVALDLNPAGAETLMAGAMPVTGTFFQATQPVSAAAMPLPAGAATSAKQPAPGTAGAASADVLTVQGVASMTALKVDGSAVTQPVSGTVTANAGTNLNTSLLAIESGGHLATIDGKVPALGQALAAASTPVVLTAAQVTTLTPLSTVTANIGTSGSLALDATLTGGTQKSKLVDSGGANVATVSAGGALKVDASATTQPVSGTLGATQSGTWTVQPGNTANSTAWLVTGTGGTFPATQSGTWNVGTVTTVSTVSAVTAITNALPAGTNLIGQVSASSETATVYSGTTALTPKFATFSTSSSGATTVVALVASKRIRVLRWRCSANGLTNIKWQSHVSPTDVSGLSYLAQYKDAGGGFCPVGHFQTVSGEALDINNSAAVAISGELTYVEV